MRTKIIKEWYEKNKMPKNSTLEHRIAWHLEHANNCSCRKIEAKLAEEMRKREKSVSLFSFKNTNNPYP